MASTITTTNVYHKEDLIKKYPDKYNCNFCYDSTKLEIAYPHLVKELKFTMNLTSAIYSILNDLKQIEITSQQYFFESKNETEKRQLKKKI